MPLDFLGLASAWSGVNRGVMPLVTLQAEQKGFGGASRASRFCPLSFRFICIYLRMADTLKLLL